MKETEMMKAGVVGAVVIDGERVGEVRFYIVSVLREANGIEQSDRRLGYEVFRGMKYKDAYRKYREMIAKLKRMKVPGRVMFEIGTKIGGEVITLFSLGNEYVGAHLRRSRMWLSVKDAEVGEGKKEDGQ
jgi:hypothetical protein